MADDRKKALEAFAKQLSEGLPFAEDHIKGELDGDVANNALLARNFSEESLGHQVLKNTGIPIPDNKASKSKIEDFYHQIMKERYPELTPKIVTGDLRSEGAAGWYNPVFDTIAMDENLHKEKGLSRAVGTMLHEAGHQYDDKMRVKSPDGKYFHSQELDLGSLRKARDSGLDLKKMDPAQVYEIYAKGHHAEIPDLREGSFGLGALKSYMKSGKFKQVAGPIVGALPLAGTALALSSGDANAAMSELPGEIPGFGQAYEAIRPTDVGSADDDKQIKAESKAFADYHKSPAGQDARRNALVKIKGQY